MLETKKLECDAKWWLQVASESTGLKWDDEEELFGFMFHPFFNSDWDGSYLINGDLWAKIFCFAVKRALKETFNIGNIGLWHFLEIYPDIPIYNVCIVAINLNNGKIVSIQDENEHVPQSLSDVKDICFTVDCCGMRTLEDLNLTLGKIVEHILEVLNKF